MLNNRKRMPGEYRPVFYPSVNNSYLNRSKA